MAYKTVHKIHYPLLAALKGERYWCNYSKGLNSIISRKAQPKMTIFSDKPKQDPYNNRYPICTTCPRILSCKNAPKLIGGLYIADNADNINIRLI